MIVERNRSDRPYTYDIIVASPNVAIDSYYVLSTLQTGSVNRTEIVHHTAGGKANNLARAAHALGGQVLSLGIVGGYSGKYIVEELARECIPCDMVFANHESRRSSTIISPNQMQTTVILDSGAPIAPAAGESLLQKTVLHAPEAPFLVLTGSLPPGLSSDYYAGVVRSVKDFPGLAVCLDCSGPALDSAAQAGVKIIKVNVSEYLVTFSNEEDFSIRGAQRTFERLAKWGLELFILTDGPRGAYVFSQDQAPFQVMTDVASWVSTAGAGDTFLAGFLISLNKGTSVEEASAFASASAAAALQQVICGNLDLPDVDLFLTRTRVSPVQPDRFGG